MPKARRGRHEGSVYRRGDGRWVASASFGFKGGKRQRRVAYGETKSEAQAKLRDLLAAGGAEKSRSTVGGFLDGWLDRKRGSVADKTYARYEQHVRLQIKPYLGSLAITELCYDDIDNWFVRCRRDGITPASIRKAAVALSNAMREAVRRRVIPFNPCEACSPPRHVKETFSVLDPEQVESLLDVTVTTRFHALFVVAITCGLRKGELFALHWGDVNLKDGFIEVSRSLQELGGELKVKEPKTTASRRRVTMPDFAIATLAEHQRAQLQQGFAGAPVFCDSRGGFLRGQNFNRREFLPALEKAGLPRIRFHDLRHTCATILLAQGVSPKVVSERLGHSSVSVTLTTYAHVLPSMQKEAIQHLDRLFA